MAKSVKKSINFLDCFFAIFCHFLPFFCHFSPKTGAPPSEKRKRCQEMAPPSIDFYLSFFFSFYSTGRISSFLCGEINEEIHPIPRTVAFFLHLWPKNGPPPSEKRKGCQEMAPPSIDFFRFNFLLPTFSIASDASFFILLSSLFFPIFSTLSRLRSSVFNATTNGEQKKRSR